MSGELYNEMPSLVFGGSGKGTAIYSHEINWQNWKEERGVGDKEWKREGRGKGRLGKCSSLWSV